MSIEIISRPPNGDKGWARWINPSKVLEAHDASNVLPLLARAEHLAAAGNYIIGFACYEAGPAFDNHFVAKTSQCPLPLAWFAVFKTFEPIELDVPERHTIPDWQPAIELDAYGKKIDSIKRSISQGETYQVNLTFPLVSHSRINAKDIFRQLCIAQPTPYAMYIEAGTFQIASVSPELFFQLDGKRIICQPMKGTAPRAPHPLLDPALAHELLQSEKNRAENLMIVDMIRNDLGRIADSGTVHTERLFEVNAWPTLWQMTSTVSANTSKPLGDIFSALFPSASITGAPKLKTSEIIAGLEDNPRGIYTGAIGWMAPGRKAQFAVAIRTLSITHDPYTAAYGVGSGIVWDSQAEQEYSECLLKAKILGRANVDQYDLLETMRWIPGQGFAFEPLHLERMKSTADFFGYPWEQNEIKQKLAAFASGQPPEPAMVRLLANAQGETRVESKPLYQPSHYENPGTAPVIQATVDTVRHNVDSVYLYHKTTNRMVYDEARKRYPDYEEVLLINQRGELMEFSNGNVVVKREGHWLTPPLSAGLLPGTFRQHLLMQGAISESPLSLSSLGKSDELYFINSVRGWRRVQLAHA